MRTSRAIGQRAYAQTKKTGTCAKQMPVDLERNQGSRGPSRKPPGPTMLFTNVAGWSLMPRPSLVVVHDVPSHSVLSVPLRNVLSWFAGLMLSWKVAMFALVTHSTRGRDSGGVVSLQAADAV